MLQHQSVVFILSHLGVAVEIPGRSKAVVRATPTLMSSALSSTLTGLSSKVMAGTQGAPDFLEPDAVVDSDLGLFDRVDWEASASADLFLGAEVVFSLEANFESGKVSSVSI